MNKYEEHYYIKGHDEGWQLGLYAGFLLGFPVGMVVSGMLAYIILN